MIISRESKAGGMDNKAGWLFEGFPEMESLASHGYPKLYQSRKVIVALRNGSVTFDRAECFEGKTPSWFIYPNRVVAWQFMPEHPSHGAASDETT